MPESEMQGEELHPFEQFKATNKDNPNARCIPAKVNGILKS
jgi:hypothetical protein